ncbi:MAG: family 43 glycosylhydrolase [Clostridiales Family XIII bacterium]|nr:family 43 glycosylhydrolase [Clostridiales Family XIII bacterium]
MKKRILSAFASLIICGSLLPAAPAMAAEAEGAPDGGIYAPAAAANPFQPKNPVIKAIFTADPEAHVWPTNPDKLYIYPSHDPYPYAGCNNMDMYHVYSTENLEDFVDEGEILRRSELNDLSWITPSTNASSFMWAPDAAYKDGWYYFYNPVPRNVNSWGATWETSVTRSRYPDRGFEQIPAEAVDANEGKPWLGFIRDSGATDGYNNMYDVCVRVYDGEAYIYNGAAQTLWQGKLKDDMVTLDGKLELVSTDNRSVANANGDPSAYNRLTNYHEGPSAFRRDGKYYLIYPGGAGNYNGLSGDSFYYCMADSPLGPWGNARIFFNPTGCGTSHGSIFEFKGKWYWAYHTQDLSNIGEQRSVAIEEVIFNDDGTIQRFGKTSAGVPQYGPDYVRPAGFTLGAEEAALGGTGTLPVLTTDEAAGNGGSILSGAGANNTTITFSNVDGGEGGRARLIFNYSTTDAVPKLNLFVNGLDYKSINFPNTGGASAYAEIEFTPKAFEPGRTNTIQLRGYNQNTRLNLNYIEVVPLDDTAPPPGYFDLTVTQAAGGTAEGKWALQDAGASLSVAAGSKVTLSYEEGTGEFEGWEAIKPADLAITDNYFYMPYGEVEVRPLFNNEGNARRPIISAQPSDVIVIQGLDAGLSVAASVKDAGTLSYQWYASTDGSNAGGTLVPGATGAAYAPSTATVGTFYYYAVVTNTNMAAAGPVKTASVTSKAVSVRVDRPPSTACDVVAVAAPLGLDGRGILANVSNHTTSIDLTDMIVISDDATWALYSDPAYTAEASKIVTLLSGYNVLYLRVTAEDGLATKDYTITIIRHSTTIGRFAAAPALDGTLAPSEWGEKAFTIAAGADGTEIMVMNPMAGYPPEGFSADVYMAYDASNVYLGLIVEDPLWTAARPGSGTLWQGCGIQLNLWSGRAGGRSEYGFGLAGTGPSHAQWANGAGTSALPSGYDNYDVKRVGDTNTFIYTIAVPLNSFRQNAAANPLAEGDELWFSLSYNYPNLSANNMTCAFNMGFHSKSLNDARSITLGPEIAAGPDVEPGIVSAAVSGSVVSAVTVRVASPRDTILLLASYTESGAMKGMQTFEPARSGEYDIAVNFDFSGAASVKAFLWDKNTFIPLAEAKAIYGP